MVEQAQYGWREQILTPLDNYLRNIKEARTYIAKAAGAIESVKAIRVTKSSQAIQNLLSCYSQAISVLEAASSNLGLVKERVDQTEAVVKSASKLNSVLRNCYSDIGERVDDFDSIDSASRKALETLEEIKKFVAGKELVLKNAYEAACKLQEMALELNQNSDLQKRISAE